MEPTKLNGLTWQMEGGKVETHGLNSGVVIQSNPIGLLCEKQPLLKAHIGIIQIPKRGPGHGFAEVVQVLALQIVQHLRLTHPVIDFDTLGFTIGLIIGWHPPKNG